MAELSDQNENGPTDNAVPPTDTLPEVASTRLILNKFTLYETKTRFYIVGTNQSDNRFRVLKIDRTDPTELSVTEDATKYTREEINQLLEMIENGNKSSGGLREVCSAYGIVGFVRFTEGYYVSLITKRSAVALIGGHYIYHIDGTMLLSISAQKVEKNSDETRYMNTFRNVDITKNFYFSYTYDITRTLQNNMTRPADIYNEMFVWNHYLLETGFRGLSGGGDSNNPHNTRNSDWILPIIHGFVDQSKISIFGQSIFVTLIARRSRYFAGARYLKRGVNDQGYVANDVETEQIVSEVKSTSFHAFGDPHRLNPAYTSYVQYRGSIPLFWAQDTTNMSPKPPIELTLIDPYFSAAALHFDQMFKRYGIPVIVLNLVKTKEKTKRESKLGDEFAQAVRYLNQFLPPTHQICYTAWDMSRAAKSHDQDVIGFLEEFAERALGATGFFHSGPEPYINVLRSERDGRGNKEKEGEEVETVGRGREGDRRMYLLQNGVVRTNCIDCLDRTNAAQFMIGKRAFGHQLYALGVIDAPTVHFDSDVVNMLTDMYHDHGDTIALQYGGSHLVNTMETYRRINQWSSHSRDMIETIRRYFSNSFADAEKQEAINLFLGNFVMQRGRPMLWELNTDYYLHNKDPRFKKPRRNYIHWWTKENLVCNTSPPARWLPAPPPSSSSSSDSTLIPSSTSAAHGPLLPPPSHPPRLRQNQGEVEYDAFWLEYYRPRLFTSFARLFAYNMNSTMKYVPQPQRSLPDPEEYDYSPFVVRRELAATSPSRMSIGGVKRFLTLSNPQPAPSSTAPPVAPAKSPVVPPLNSLEAMIARSLAPQVTPSETKEYKRYIHQFRHVHLSGGLEGEGEKGHPEWETYAAYVAQGKGGEKGTGAEVRIGVIDMKVYEAYCNRRFLSAYL
ncbi:uncharacterized protein VTP21DRAFT_1459 [Calcarisporiella thermophila]|uniref:uncharacterized protein n=1 Tax=Calcarisporiella thermophila TaxID=911321 RepID=UPI00374498B5